MNRKKTKPVTTSRPDDSLLGAQSGASSEEPRVIQSRQAAQPVKWNRRAVLQSLLLAAGSAAMTGCGLGGGNKGSTSKESQKSSQGLKLKWFPAHSDKVLSVGFSQDGSLLITSSLDATAKVWKVTDGTLLMTYKRLQSSYTPAGYYAAISPDGTLMAAGGSDGIVAVCKVVNGAAFFSFTEHLAAITGIAFSPDGGSIASCDAAGVVLIWNCDNGELIRTYAGHTSQVNTVNFSASGTQTLSASNDGTVQIWKIADGSLVKKFIWPFMYHADGTASSGPIGEAVFNASDSAMAASVQSNYGFDLVSGDVASGSTNWNEGNESSTIYAISANPTGAEFSMSIPRYLVIVSTQTGLGTYYTLSSPIQGTGQTAIAFGPDGTSIATGSSTGEVVILSASSRQWSMFFTDKTLTEQSYSACTTENGGVSSTWSSTVWGGSAAALHALWCICDVTCTCDQVCTCDSESGGTICTCNLVYS